MCLNPHQADVSESLSRWMGEANMKRDSREIKVDPNWDQHPSWSFNGPYRAPKMDLMIFEPISGSLYHFYIVHNDVPL